MADAASNEEDEIGKKMKEAMEETELILRRISTRLQQAPGAARVATEEYRVSSFFKLMHMELSAILEQLRRQQTLTLEEFRLREMTEIVRGILDEYERPPPRHVLLHRAARCLRRTTTAGLSKWERPVLYKHLMLVGDDGDDTAASTSSRIYIPFSLKLSSLYMVSMFPPGYIFEKHRLNWRWTSEVLTSRERCAEYFSELVDREVITRAANYGEKPAAEEGCHWQLNPDMLQSLATESANKGIVCTSGMLNSPAATVDNASTDILRWLSLHQPDPKLPTLLETKDLSQTRSLAVSGAVKGIPLDKFIYLRVLDLEGWQNLKDEELTLICNKMLLLSYLGVRNTGVTRLPPEIKELHILNVLDVSHTSIRELPSEVCELEWLTALDLRSTQIRQLPEQIAESTCLLDLLIGGDGINPDEIAAKIPEGILRAGKLLTLATADLSECSASYVEALGRRLCYLEVLAITWSFQQCTDGRYQDALRSSIGKWNYLKSLTIHCGLGCSMEFLDAYLPEPPRKLETFKVTTGRFFLVPKWIQGLQCLSFLQITVCKLGTDDLKILGELPKLQCLVLGLDFLPEEAIEIPSEWFSRLRTFSADCLVPWLFFTQGAMPELTYLDLEICSSVPPNQEIVLSGISNLKKLAEVVLRYNKRYSNSSSVKMTVEAVEKAIVEHRNRINLVINNFSSVLALMYKRLLLVGDYGNDTAASTSSRTCSDGDDADNTLASTSSRIYSELPSRLKLWSLYMASMFPQGYIFDKHRLSWRWAFEDHLNSAEYFSELFNREVITKAANYGEKPAAEDWQVNPDMLQFLATESANKGIVYTSGMLNSAAATGDNASTDALCWLSLHQPDPNLPTLLETKDLSQTRSLAVSGAVKGIPLDKFIYLRVLDLEGWENLKDEDLPLICSKMLLLSYLGVRNTGVTRLPPEIKELHNLNVLDVSHTSIRELPSEVRQLKWLDSLDLRSTQIRQLPEQIVECKHLRDLLIGGDGINPDEIAAKIPERMVRAGNLRTLATADLSECSESYIEALGRLLLLEVLAITWSFHQCTDGRYQDALRSSIGKWRHLKSLTIHCGLGCSMEFLGSQLSHPPQELEAFKVTTGRFFVVPKWIQRLKYLSFLQITVCKLGADDLKILGELPKLQCLVLGLDFLPEEAIVIPSQGFSRLRTFSVDCLVPWLFFTQGAMPSLTYLDLEICSSVPPNQEIVLSGISNLEKLAEVVLRYNKMYSNSSSVKMAVEAVNEAVKKAVVKHRNRINLVINGIQRVVQAEAPDEEI